jgi:glutamate--cysteine ligase
MISKTMKLMAEQIHKNHREINAWFSNYTSQFAPPFYCSVDLRDSGHKIVPVDSNLFPAGFNNICPEDLRTAPALLRRQIDSILSQLGRSNHERILIIPESHTQNAFYIENLFYLHQLVENAGFTARIGWYGELPNPMERTVSLTSATGKTLTAYPLKIEAGYLSADEFVPDLILLNNDFSGGYPALLDSVIQPIVPSHTLGWHSRKKSDHFKHYNRLAGEFAEMIGIDPWTIQIDTEEFEPVNFNEGVGIEEVAQSVDRILERTKKFYESHQIQRKPFVFVKNNSGTYGMGILVAHSGDEVRQMNRRTKNKMSIGKNRRTIESVVIQEGVPTSTLIDRLIAEPVIYLFGTDLMGGFLRTHSEKGDEDNLNAQGMVFRKLCMSDLRTLESDASEGETSNQSQDLPVLELVYGAVARISALATGMELAKSPHGWTPEAGKKQSPTRGSSDHGLSPAL